MEGGTVTMSEALVTGLTSVANDMTGVVTSILPVALPIIGAVLVVCFGIKIFKKIAGRA